MFHAAPSGRIEGPDRIRLIYIVGQGHSGSTLLDLLLSGHSDVVSVGEAKMFRPPRVKSRCNCRRDPVGECPFWRRVGERFTRKTSVPLAHLHLDTPDEARFEQHNLAFFDAVARVSGKRVIVDSSKSLSRLRRLSRLTGLEIDVIHLVRRPHGVVFSNMRKGRHWLRTSRSYGRVERSVRRWLHDRDHIRVRYEELATQPAATLARVMTELGPGRAGRRGTVNLAYQPQQLEWTVGERHNISGNRTRFSKVDTIALDVEWKQGLGRLQQLAITAITTDLTRPARPRPGRSGRPSPVHP